MGKQEILPPETVADAERAQRSAHGHFAKGHNKSGGRAPGSINLMPAELKDMVREALDNLGGVNYLTMIGAMKPELFIGLVGRCVPLKITNENEKPRTLVVVSTRIIDPVKK
jgi:hypothetical protein